MKRIIEKNYRRELMKRIIEEKRIISENYWKEK